VLSAPGTLNMTIIAIGVAGGNRRPSTPELERFASQCVGGGRYDNVSEVVCAAPPLLRETEDRRREFNRMLREAREESDRDGGFSIESGLAEMDEVIASAKQ
jgi:antitoxin ParD1/3/4